MCVWAFRDHRACLALSSFCQGLTRLRGRVLAPQIASDLCTAFRPFELVRDDDEFVIIAMDPKSSEPQRLVIN